MPAPSHVTLSGRGIRLAGLPLSHTGSAPPAPASTLPLALGLALTLILGALTATTAWAAASSQEGQDRETTASRASAQTGSDEAAQPETRQETFFPSLTASGESVWSLRYAWGDLAGLMSTDLYAPGRPTLEQQLRLRLMGDVAPGITVSADLDNVRGENLQLMGIDVRWGPTATHIGDIQLQSESRYAVSQTTLKGVRVTGQWGAWELTALAGRSQGIPATKTFYGRNSQDMTRWVPAGPSSPAPPYSPKREGSTLVGDIHGAQGFRLARAFDADFMKVWLVPSDYDPGAGCDEQPDTRRSLKQLLDDFGLGYLYDSGEAGTPRGVLKPQPYEPPSSVPPPGLNAEDVARAFFPLATGQYTAVVNADGRQPAGYILLKVETLELLRSHVELLIRRFNELNRLVGADRRTYPFVRGSELERRFLTMLRQYYRVEAGAGAYPGADGWTSAMAPLVLPGQRGTAPTGPVRMSWLGTCSAYRHYLGTGVSNPAFPSDGATEPEPTMPVSVFYLTGNTELQPDSLEVTVQRLDGSVEKADGHGFEWTLFPEQGVLKVTFPQAIGQSPGTIEAFTHNFRALQARYQYQVSEGVYALGTAVAAGSDKVFLNGNELRRDIDYTIDYETGVLVLLREVGPADRIEVRFEYFRSGLGATAEYNRNVFGLRAGWKPDEQWQLVGELFFAGDEARPLVDPDRARTMPNSHTVAALVGGYRAWQGKRPDQGFWALVDAAWSHDEYPFDDNLREQQPNEVLAIAGSRTSSSGGGYVLVGHRGGLAVGYLDPSREVLDGGWHLYDTGAGLSGLTVTAVAPAVPGAISDGSVGDPTGVAQGWVLGTESGLTLVLHADELGGTPFDSTTNWARRYMSDGLPSNRIRDVLYVGVVPPMNTRVTEGLPTTPAVWIATDRGLAWSPATELSTGALREWHVLDTQSRPAVSADDYRSLAFVRAGGDAGAPSAAALLAAGPSGVVWLPLWGFDPKQWGAGIRTLFVGQRVDRVAAVCVDCSSATPLVRVFAGGPTGLEFVDIRPHGDGTGAYQRVDSILGAVRSLQLVSRPSASEAWDLWVGTDRGLYVVRDVHGTGPVTAVVASSGVPVTAVGVVPGTEPDAYLWAGTRPPLPGQPGLLMVGPLSQWPPPAPDPVKSTPPTEVLPERDPARYQDPARRRVYNGVAGQVALGYKWLGGSVEAGYERVDAPFLAINDVQRRAVEGWYVSARHQFARSLQLEVRHADRRTAVPLISQDRQEMTPQASGSQRTISDEMSLTWTLPLPAPVSWASPPAMRGSVRWDRIDRDGDGAVFEVTALSRTIQIQESLWDGHLTAAAGYEYLRYREEGVANYTAHNLLADLTARPAPDVSFSVRYRYPLKVNEGDSGLEQGMGPSRSRVQGTPDLQLGATASRVLGSARATLSVTQQSGWQVTDAGVIPQRLSRQANLSVAAPSLLAGAWRLSPVGRVEWSFTESAASRMTIGGVNTSVQATWQPASLHVTLDAGRRYQVAQFPMAKQSIEDRLSITTSTRALSRVEPALTLSREIRHVTSLGDARYSSTLSHAATLQLGWSLSQLWQESTRLGVQWTDEPAARRSSRNVEIAHSVTWRRGAPWSVSGAVRGSLGEVWAPEAVPRPLWRVEVSGQAEYRLSAQWSTGVELGYARGQRLLQWTSLDTLSAGEPLPFQSGWGRLFVRATF